MAKSEFDQFISDELERIKGVYHPVNAGRLERLLVRKCACTKLLPNPEDEFTDPAIGPNYGIISDYSKQFRRNIDRSLPLMDEPVIVRKMRPRGYMLLNGHHRWAAALGLRIKRIPVRIVNTVLDSDIRNVLERSTHDKRVTLDLDEVVFRPLNDPNIEKPHKLIRFGIHKKGLRLGIPALFIYLSKNGYDIWVYSSNYYSTDDVSDFFKGYGVGVDGIITGQAPDKKKAGGIRPETEKLIRNKYDRTIHIDNDLMVITFGRAGEFIEVPLDASPKEWARQIINALERKMDPADHEK